MDEAGLHDFPHFKWAQYSTFENRLKTFKLWPISIPIKPKSFASAGFFYSGFGDNVTSHCCGISLIHWEKFDNPWIEHFKYSNENCFYLKFKKRELFLNICEYVLQLMEKNLYSEPDEIVEKFKTQFPKIDNFTLISPNVLLEFKNGKFKLTKNENSNLSNGNNCEQYTVYGANGEEDRVQGVEGVNGEQNRVYGVNGVQDRVYGVNGVQDVDYGIYDNRNYARTDNTNDTDSCHGQSQDICGNNDKIYGCTNRIYGCDDNIRKRDISRARCGNTNEMHSGNILVLFLYCLLKKKVVCYTSIKFVMIS